MMKTGRLALALSAALAAGGCVSGTDIEGIHRHLGELDKKVDAASKQSSSKEEVAKLSEAIQKQAQTILRSNADLGARFDELIREMQTLAGKLEDANRRLSQLSQQIAATGTAAPAAAPPSTPVGTPTGAPTGTPVTQAPSGLVPPPQRGPSPADLFAQATADYQRGQYELARQGFQEYLETYPKTDLSDDAAYWMGECYSALKKPADAIVAFDRLLKLYPQSDKASAAYLKKALAHLELGQKREAIVQLQWVVHEYPGSDEAKSARQRLKTLGSDSR